MDNVLHVQAYGDIENIQAAGASEWGVVSLKSITDQIKTNPDATEIVVHIHSRGGDVIEGFAIHDALVATGKKITTVIEGLCASIATVVALAGSTRRMTENSTFMIHNPWSLGMGTADELQKQADTTREAENKLLDFYVQKTGGDREQIQSMMDVETNMDPDKALEMKFVTDIMVPANAKVYAKYIPKNKTMSDKKTVFEKINAILVKAGLKDDVIVIDKTEPVKALDLDVEGNDVPLHIETEAAEPAIGDMVTQGGAAVPDQTFTMKDGSTITTDADSKISAITPAPAAADPAPDAKDKQIEDLTAKVAAMETEIAAAKERETAMAQTISENNAAFQTITEKMEKLSASIGSGFKPDDRQQQFRNKGKATGNDGQNENVADAIAKRKKMAQERKVAAHTKN